MWGSALQYFTGSKEHSIALRKIAIKKGLKLSEYGVFRGEKAVAGKTEKDVGRDAKVLIVVDQRHQVTGNCNYVRRKQEVRQVLAHVAALVVVADHPGRHRYDRHSSLSWRKLLD